jgi:TRAP-type mannitol/chloroaromatic compound transport system permease small subunit
VTRLIDAFTDATGRLIAWCMPLIVLGTMTIVVLRYALAINTTLIQELVLYLHGLAFMLAIPWALKHNAHVRVDLVYNRLSARGQAWVNLIGHVVLLFPTGIFILLESRGYVAMSWRMREGSPDVGGIQGVFLLKTLIPAMAVLLLLQGIAEILRAARVLQNRDT